MADIPLRADLDWDDRLWEQVWDRTLNPMERHRIARHLWHRRVPDDPLERTVVAELRHRWRRRARNLAILYGLWTLFWGLLALSDVRTDLAFRSLLTPGCTLVGVLAVGACFAVRHRLRAAAVPAAIRT